MKVFILGVAGETGLRLARLLKARGDEVGGLYRRPEQNDVLSAIGVAGTIGDIATLDDRRLADMIVGCDAIVFTAGAGVSDDEAMTEAVDGDGVTKSIAAAALAGVRRFFLVSVFPEAGRGGRVDEGFEHYVAVKKRTDVELAQTDLDWVILRPSALKNEAGVGTVNLGPAQFHTEVRRDDVAATIAELIHALGVRRQILELTEGRTPVAQAVAAQAIR